MWKHAIRACIQGFYHDRNCGKSCVDWGPAWTIVYAFAMSGQPAILFTVINSSPQLTPKLFTGIIKLLLRRKLQIQRARDEPGKARAEKPMSTPRAESPLRRSSEQGSRDGATQIGQLVSQPIVLAHERGHPVACVQNS